MLNIRPILYSEISQLRNFPPEDWKLDLPRLFTFHFSHPYFYPVVAELKHHIVGCGIAMVQGSIGWLGTIIVLPEYRKQGIGEAMTRHLMNHCIESGCTSQLLTASEMGEPLYLKLGFNICGLYQFYRRESPLSFPLSSAIREIREEDRSSVQTLDRNIMGEERFSMMERFLSTAHGYINNQSNDLEGVFIPDFGHGLILARSAEAGVELMKFRINSGKTTAVIPSTNTIARESLVSHSFQEFRTAPRMFYGKEVLWRPSMVFNRSTGYCG